MHLVILVLAGWLGLMVLLIWALRSIRYGITDRYFKVYLFKMPIRRLRLDNIRKISTDQVWLAEKWHNCFNPGNHRILVLHKKRGLFRRFVITPRQRYVVKAEIERARAALAQPRETSPDTGRASTRRVVLSP